MKLQHCFITSSFHYTADPDITSVSDRIEILVGLLERIQENGEHLYHSNEWWEQEILEGVDISALLYGNGGKNIWGGILLARCFERSKSVMMDSDQYEQILNRHYPLGDKWSYIAFYEVLSEPERSIPPDLIQRCSDDWHLSHRYYLSGITIVEEYFYGIMVAFPNLSFSDHVRYSLNDFSHLRDHVAEITRHLCVLNDHGGRIYREHGPDPDTVFRCLRAEGSIECSSQGDPVYAKEHFRFEFLSDGGAQVEVICSPHTKLYDPGSSYRIYFNWGERSVAAGEKLLVGHIGRHL